MKWIVHTLVPSELVIEMGRLTYMRNYGKSDFFPCPCFVLQSQEGVVLVDTSGSAADMAPLRAEPVRDIMSFADALATLDLTPADIKTVVFTHLMYDHCANASLMPADARFVVQKKELEYAYNPHPMWAGAYQKHFFDSLEFDLIEGDVELMPGLRLIFTPGHSAGCQSVLVDTDAGVVGITGFCCVGENFEQSGGAWASVSAPQVIPPGIHLDMREAYDSAVRMKSEADIILPMHDKSLLDIKRIPD